MTYKELKLFSMQKMFCDITDLTQTNVTKPYLDKMPYVASCALSRAAALGFSKKKSVQITKIAIVNEIANVKKDEPHTVVSKNIEFNAQCGKAFYFEACGRGKAEIYVGKNQIKTVVFDTKNTFLKYKGIFENPDFSTVKIVFLSGEPYIVRNVSVYNADFSKEEDVFENTQYEKYDLKEITNDFFSFDTSRFVEEKSNCKISNFRFCGDSEIEIRNDVSGSWNVPYLAYPTVINKETPDEEEIDLPYELCMILPFYIASELYLEEDSALAVGWRNKFESSLSEYSALRNQKASKKAKIVNIWEEQYGKI